jgi:hypothetical protein
MSGICDMHEGKFQFENLKGRDHLGDQYVNGRIMDLRQAEQLSAAQGRYLNHGVI